MLPEKVDEMLRNYKSYKGRCAHLELAIEMAERELAQMQASMSADAAYHVQRYDTMDMPRGTDVGTPTEDIALRFAAGYVPDEVREKVAQIGQLRDEFGQKMITVRFVEAWLEGLTEKERWLIEQQVIEGKYWREITIAWQRKFGEQYGKDHIRKLRVLALEKVYRTAS